MISRADKPVWAPCAASRLNKVRLNAGNVITLHEPSKANPQGINNLQFPFELSQNAIKIYQEFIKHNFPYEFPISGFHKKL